MRWLIGSTLALLLLVAPLTFSQAVAKPPGPQGATEVQYKPLTREEATAWLKSITMDQLIDFVIKYDEVEHSKIVFDFFDYVAVISGQSVAIVPVNPTIAVKLASLGYRVALPTMEFKDLVPRPEDHFWRDFGIGAGVGGAVGIGLTTLIVLIVSGVVK